VSRREAAGHEASGIEYRLIDADEHYCEPDDCFSRHIEPRLRDETIRADRGADGLGRVYLRRRRTVMSVMPGDYASAPGALRGACTGSAPAARRGRAAPGRCRPGY
jgi:hypothetical protein